MAPTEEKVQFSAFLKTAPRVQVQVQVRPPGDWFEWTDNQGQTVYLCLVIQSDGGPPLVMADRNGTVSTHNPFPWLAA
jgi:hypothetical protein